MVVAQHKLGNIHTYQYYCIAYSGIYHLDATRQINIHNPLHISKKMR